ncbi:trypsin-like peptidase domain-containing protein [Sorangium sp. So ce385]|uniref:trypsin-like peptidase domain-containing protein n=1 Tax=Sorangium sp. So ce385 TaxID=3133308 RepID=UPI003F5B5104
MTSDDSSVALSAAQRAYVQRVLRAPSGREEAAPRGAPFHEPYLEGAPADSPSARGTLLAKVREGEPIGLRELDALEAMIRDDRPVCEIQDDTFPAMDGPWRDVEACRAAVELAIRCVGRIDLVDHPSLVYGGTGVLVGPRTMVTNRHVAELFAQGRGTRLSFTPGLRASLDLKHEHARTSSVRFDVLEPLLLHPYWDVALLRVRAADETPFLRLLGQAPASLDGRPVAIVGYPMFDPRNDLERQRSVFRGIFGCKRLAPGTLMGRGRIRSYAHVVEAMTHDASTLGGNSGSVVLDLETGQAIGIHFAGIYMTANYAVPSWELGMDRRLMTQGARFAPDPPGGGAAPEIVEEAWRAVEGAAQEAGAAAAPREEVLSPFEWYERQDDASLAEALRRAPEATRAQLARAVGEEEAREIAAFLRPASPEEGIFDPEPDPDLPEIVLVHGILGAHLEHRGASTLRVWLSALTLLFGDVAERLKLGADGVSDATRGQVLAPGPHLQLAYGRAARAFRQERFVVHPFSYDWRKGIQSAAERLRLYLEMLALDRPRSRFMIVAHSMGGLVAACWAGQDPQWAQRVQRAVFAGSPLGGSYAPIEAVQGTYPFFQRLAMVASLGEARAAARRAFREAAATMPGLVDMLPNLAMFPDAEPFYTQGGWGGGVRPSQRLLDQSRTLKRRLVESPILDRTTLFASLSHGTVTSWEFGAADAQPRGGVGDGTVPARAAVIAGVPAYRAEYEHSDLLRDPGVIAGVIELARTGECSAPRVTEEDLEGGAPVALVETPEGDEARAREVRERARRGELLGEDVRWLLRGSSGEA